MPASKEDLRLKLMEVVNALSESQEALRRRLSKF